MIAQFPSVNVKVGVDVNLPPELRDEVMRLLGKAEGELAATSQAALNAFNSLTAAGDAMRTHTYIQTGLLSLLLLFAIVALTFMVITNQQMRDWVRDRTQRLTSVFKRQS